MNWNVCRVLQALVFQSFLNYSPITIKHHENLIGNQTVGVECLLNWFQRRRVIEPNPLRCLVGSVSCIRLFTTWTYDLCLGRCGSGGQQRSHWPGFSSSWWSPCSSHLKCRTTSWRLPGAAASCLCTRTWVWVPTCPGCSPTLSLKQPVRVENDVNVTLLVINASILCLYHRSSGSCDGSPVPILGTQISQCRCFKRGVCCVQRVFISCSSCVLLVFIFQPVSLVFLQ